MDLGAHGPARCRIKSVTFFSPRAAVAWKLGTYALQGAVYHANRPPTLNELHRGFRVGNVGDQSRTRCSNPKRSPASRAACWRRGPTSSARVTTFFNTLDGAIANITLSSTPTQITRERRNSDEIRATGVEMEVDARLTPTLSLNGQLVLHVEPLPRFGGDAGDRRQLRAAGAGMAGRLRPDVDRAP